MRAIQSKNFYSLSEVVAGFGLEKEGLPSAILSRFSYYLYHKGFVDIRKFDWISNESPQSQAVFIEGLVLPDIPANQIFHTEWIVLHKESSTFKINEFSGSEFLIVNGESYTDYMECYLAPPSSSRFVSSWISFGVDDLLIREDDVREMQSSYGIDFNFSCIGERKSTEIEPKLLTSNFPDSVKKAKNLSSKSENYYLRTIRDLANLALANGLTGVPHTDAQNIIKKWELNGIDPPVKKDKLADYFKQSKLL